MLPDTSCCSCCWLSCETDTTLFKCTRSVHLLPVPFNRCAAWFPASWAPGDHLGASRGCASGRQEARRHGHRRTRHPRRQVCWFTAACLARQEAP
jgi:hypothetical protein